MICASLATNIGARCAGKLRFPSRRACTSRMPGLKLRRALRCAYRSADDITDERLDRLAAGHILAAISLILHKILAAAFIICRRGQLCLAMVTFSELYDIEHGLMILGRAGSLNSAQSCSKWPLLIERVNIEKGQSWRLRQLSSSPSAPACRVGAYHASRDYCSSSLRDRYGEAFDSARDVMSYRRRSSYGVA